MMTIEEALEPLTPAALAKEAYYVACEKVCETMRLRDEAWAVYERARAEQLQSLLPR